MTKSSTKSPTEIRFGFYTRLVEEGSSILKTILWVFCFCFIGYWFFQMLKDVSQANEGSISALAKVVEKFSVDRIILAITNAVTGAGWWLSRSRNKRLTKKLGERRHDEEMNDPVNDRSGLDKFGRKKGE